MTINEAHAEALDRMSYLGVPHKALNVFKNGKIPVTTFNAVMQSHLDPIHIKVMRMLLKNVPNAVVYYITEHWDRGCIISLLYIDRDWDEDDLLVDRESTKEGYPSIFAYNIDDKFSELGSGYFSVQDGVLWREW